MNFKNFKRKEIMDKLSELAEERKQNLEITPDMFDNVIGCVHSTNVKLIHLIKTEDKIYTTLDLSKEIKEYNERISKEWIDTVVEPFYENVAKFLERHSEYCIKNLEIESKIATTKGLLLEDAKQMFGGLL